MFGCFPIGSFEQFISQTLGREDTGKIVFLCLKIELRSRCLPAHFSSVCELWGMSDGRRGEVT